MQRFALIAAAVVIAVVAFIALKPGDSNSTKSTPAPDRTAQRKATSGAGTPAAPPATRITVVKGQASDGVKRIVLKSGTQARIVVSSQDTTSEVHLHGYDIEKKMAPGRPVTFTFRANLEGIFDMELHEDNAQIAKVEVQP